MIAHLLPSHLREQPRALKRGSRAGGGATLEVLPIITARVASSGEITTISTIVRRGEWYCVYLWNGECYELNEAELDMDFQGWRELLVNARLERI